MGAAGRTGRVHAVFSAVEDRVVPVNAILPGFVPTETVKEALSMKDEDFIGFEDTLGLPAGRLGTPQDIGALTLYLCAPASEWVTGQCIRIAGTP